ncbi:hypothetical protein JB92DRAFT_2717217, partial [Gautieria morchelliformis]
LGLTAPFLNLFKHHPNLGKFNTADRVVALKDPNRGFPVGQPLCVPQWRYAGRDESFVPLSSAFLIVLNIWPTPSHDGTCEVSIAYELQNTKTHYRMWSLLIVSRTTGSYPTVTPGYNGQWSLN